MIYTQLELKTLISKYNVESYDAMLLLQYVLGCSYSTVCFSRQIDFSEQQLEKLRKCLDLRHQGMPVAKIIGSKSFYNHKFKTTVDTLDPRPETELIVDLFQDYFQDKTAPLSILDLGCGTGCIGLSILDLYPNSTLCLADISSKALAVARDNAIALNCFDRCTLVGTDWFKNISNTFDVIVSNPPYISNDYSLDRDTLYDPHMALFGGEDGIDAYRNILPVAHKFLQKNGLMFLEIGINQCNSICELCNKLKILNIVKDLQGIDRTVVLKATNQFEH